MKASTMKSIIGATLLCCINIVAVNAFTISKREISQAPHCESEIYCVGDILHTIQMAKLFNDSKTFVDMSLKKSPEETVVAFKIFMNNHTDAPTPEDVRQFVNDNFNKRGSEFMNWTPSDWKETPAFLSNVKDDTLRQFGSDLNDLWKILGRKMSDNVGKNPDLYSIIYVENGVIVPGGRFLEFYYWDSYWIMRGLLYSEMYETTKGMLRNFLSIIDRYGFIPNGGRIYYLTRSHPPLLPMMVNSYVEMTGDTEFIKEALPNLEREFEFFEKNHMIDVNGHSLAVYGYDDKTASPRPESYYEDFKTAEHWKSSAEKSAFYAEMICGAESGMDYTSRWFIKNSTDEGRLIDIKCHSIVPVDLNSFLFWNAKIIAEFHTKTGNTQAASVYAQKAQDLYDAIQAILWNDERGAWFDFDLINQKHRLYFVPSNLSPLWVGCYNAANKSAIAKKVVAYIESEKIDSFPGGIPNTLLQTGEQWDYPNAWAPMQYMVTEGLRSLNDKDATDLADKFTIRWVQSNYIAFKETHAMFEKYSCETLGGHGGGGEYDTQIGFGWTNGVIIEYLAKYGDFLMSTSRN